MAVTPVPALHTGTCRLCLETHALVQSHIIPDFQFKPLKKKEGLFYALSPDPAQKERKLQRGFTERLLCAECDNVRLARNEAYFAQALTRANWPNTTVTDRLLIFRDHDYRKTKNYFLSVLWRMSISSLDLFAEVSLGAEHEEILRQGLLADREFGENEYPVTVTAPFFDGVHHADLILQPDTSELDGHRLYRCVIAGLLYTYFVGSAPLPEEMKILNLRREEFVILRAEVREIPFLAQAVHQLGPANAARGTDKKHDR